MEGNLITLQNTNDRYKLTKGEFQNSHSNIDSFSPNEKERKKAIRYVVNMRNNKSIYQSPKVRHANKFFESDFSYDGDSNNKDFKHDKLLIRDMQL